MDQEWRTGVLDRLTVGLIAADAGGRVRLMNEKAQSVTGWPEPEALGKDLAEILNLKGADNTAVTGDLFQKVLKQEAPATESSYSLVCRSGEEVGVECGFSPVQNEEQQVIGASAVFWPTRADAEPEAAPSVEGQPEFDAVTGLPGRAQAKNAIYAAQKAKTKMFAALFVLERYYRTGRKYGNATANEVLTYYCTFLAQEIQASPHCGGLFHWAGPSFVALLGPWDSLPIAQREISRFGRLKLVEEFQASSRTVLLSLSAALKVFPVEMPLEKLVSQLDSFLAVQTKADDDLVTMAMS